jgi:hypothetical protein
MISTKGGGSCGPDVEADRAFGTRTIAIVAFAIVRAADAGMSSSRVAVPYDFARKIDPTFRERATYARI